MFGRLTRPLLVLALIGTPAAMIAQTQHAQTRQGFGISFGFGNGSAGAVCNECSSERENGLSGYLRIGGYIRPDLFLAGESHGWLHSEAGIDSQLGFYTASAQWYPNPSNGLYLKGGLGFATYAETDGVDDLNASAAAIVVGAGFDIRLGANFSLTPYLNYLRSMEGQIKYNDISTGYNMSANLFQLGLGFTWH